MPSRILYKPDSRSVIIPSSIAFLRKFDCARADDDQFAELVRDFHHFVKTDAALVAGVVAGLTAAAFIEL